MSKKELIIGFFEKGYCCDLDEVKDTCLDLLKENQKLKAELQLYQGALKREHETIHRVNDLEEENQELKEEINKISKKELKVRDMLYSIENGTLTRERLIQIEEVLFEFGDSNELGYADINARNERKYLRNE